MFWPIWKYEDYIQAHSGAMESVDLLAPPSELVDTDVARVFVTYFNMAEWMDWYDLPPDDSAFKILLHRYRVEVRDYKASLRKQFKPIPPTAMGKALLKEIGAAGHRVTFKPNWNWADIVNADAAPDSYRDAHAQGQRFRQNGHRRVGTGDGSRSTIRYTPGMWGPTGAAKIHTASFEPDELIYHEMVHASRQMRGVQLVRKVKDYDDVEEYLAVVLTNIYMSENGKTVFLGDHDVAALQHPEKFLDNAQNSDMPPRELISLFKGAQPDFYRDVANVAKAKFNPVSQYETELRAGAALARTMFSG
jgi:fructose-specific component phosphotransferase system IIB-like protein